MNKKDITIEFARSEIDYDPHTGKFTRKITRGRHKQGTEAGGYPRGRKGYLGIRVFGVPFYAHVFAWFHFYGEWPKFQIDHINEIKTDNRICNLRECSQEENMKNCSKARKNNLSTGVRGVHFSKNEKKFKAFVTISGKRIHLGTFHEIEDAINARHNAEKLHYGKYAPLRG